MARFPGFPDGAFAATPLPNQFFAQILPQIDSLAELHVTLFVLWKTGAGARAPYWVSLDSILAEPSLLTPLTSEPGGARSALRDGLHRAIERGTLLRARVGAAGAEREVVAPNTARSRRALADRHTVDLPVDTVTQPKSSTHDERPRIFALYEENIGLIQPLVAEELKATAQLYPPSWVEDAFRQAVAYNRRNWRYIRRILERWATDGREGRTTSRPGAARAANSAADRKWTQTYRPGEPLPDL